MKTLFSELYNKILELFQIDKTDNTGDCATNRLQVILMHDRTKLDPLIMAKMREELIEVFSKYVVIDKEKLEIDLKNEGNAAALMLNIPILRAKTEEELEILRNQLKEESEQTIKTEEVTVEADLVVNSDDENVAEAEIVVDEEIAQSSNSDETENEKIYQTEETIQE